MAAAAEQVAASEAALALSRNRPLSPSLPWAWRDMGSVEESVTDSRKGQASGRWRRPLLGFGLLVLIAVLYRDFLDWLIWNATQGGVESHCASVPLLAAGLAWLRRDRLEGIESSPSLFGVFMAIWAVVLQLMATAADSLLVSGISLIILVHSVAFAIWGPAVVRLMLAPIYFLVFMLPLRYPVEIVLGFPLRVLSCQLTALGLSTAGVPVERIGTVLELPNFTIQVVSPCSGLNILSGLLLIAAFYATALRLRPFAFGIVVASAVPASLLANAARIAVIGLVGSRWGSETALRVFHDYSGHLTFAAAAAGVLAAGMLLRAREESSPESGANGSEGVTSDLAKEGGSAGTEGTDGPVDQPAVLARLIFLLALAVTADSLLVSNRSVATIPDLNNFPTQVAGVSGQDETLMPEERLLESATGGQILRRAFVSESGTVWLALVASGASWRAHHPPEYCYTALGWNVLDNRVRQLEGGASYRELVAEKGGERRVVQYWFTDGRRSTASLIGRWFAAMESGFRGKTRQPWLLVSVSAREADRDLLGKLQPAMAREASRHLLRSGSVSE